MLYGSWVSPTLVLAEGIYLPEFSGLVF